MVYNSRDYYQNEEENCNLKILPNFIFLYYYLNIYAKFYKFKYITPERLEKALKVEPKHFINDPEKDISKIFLSFIKNVLYRKGWENHKNKWIKTLGYIMNDEFPVNHPLIPESGLYDISSSGPLDRLEILKVLCELQIREHKEIKNFTKIRFKKLKINYLDLMETFFLGNDSEGNKYYNTYGALLYKIDEYDKIFVFKDSIEQIEQFIMSLTKNDDKKLKLNLKNIIEDLKEYEHKKNEYFKRYLKPTRYELQLEQENLKKRKLIEEKKALEHKKLKQNLKKEYLLYREIYIPEDQEDINIELLQKDIENRKTDINYESLCLRLESVFKYDRNFDCKNRKNSDNSIESVNNTNKKENMNNNYEPIIIEDCEDIEIVEEITNNTINEQKSNEMEQKDIDNTQKTNEKNKTDIEDIKKSNDILGNTSNSDEILMNNNDHEKETYPDEEDDNIMDYTLIEPLINIISNNMDHFRNLINNTKIIM